MGRVLCARRPSTLSLVWARPLFRGPGGFLLTAQRTTSSISPSAYDSVTAYSLRLSRLPPANPYSIARPSGLSLYSSLQPRC